ncbi:hypothetical protein GTGU_04124 [Trabulsiella guamensis ATCC 49490]|uniref:Phage holin n=2 Tax=Trabulsiella guamensis TaxID=158852 RepID=A0A084ZPS3_9ENTR|nr:hypothetical protein GTGU_04124 [Trabulsiella guamensis ATCC 49490]
MKWIATYLPALYAACAAVSISALMSIYDGKSLVQTITGSIACGIMTLAIAGSLEFLGFPANAVTFLGASIGFLGAEKVRNKVTSFIEGREKGQKGEQ